MEVAHCPPYLSRRMSNRLSIHSLTAGYCIPRWSYTQERAATFDVEEENQWIASLVLRHRRVVRPTARGCDVPGGFGGSTWVAWGASDWADVDFELCKIAGLARCEVVGVKNGWRVEVGSLHLFRHGLCSP